MIGRATWAIGTVLLLGGCGQGVLAGDASQSADFAALFRIFLVVTIVAFALVMAFLALAIARRGRGDATESGVDTLFLGWVGLIAVTLSALAIASFFTDRSLAAREAEPGISLTVTAKQWWWSIEYDGADPSQTIRTANELHLPLGVPAHIVLKSSDVIHSLWIPRLAGKQDLIPGRTNDITITPRRVGVYRGECAEFCGAQHAHMALDVTVEPIADFQRWRAAQLASAAPPRDALAAAGLAYVTSRECGTCHAIAGTPAAGTVGPDLTHLASRKSLAAGTLPMSRAGLYAWVADPQSQKPGTKMPTLDLEPNDLHAIVAYLEGLK